MCFRVCFQPYDLPQRFCVVLQVWMLHKRSFPSNLLEHVDESQLQVSFCEPSVHQLCLPSKAGHATAASCSPRPAVRHRLE